MLTIAPSVWLRLGKKLPSVPLQSMLVQHDGKTICLSPAWSAEWDVSFRLHAPYNMIIEETFRNRKPGKIDVSPAARRKNIVMGMSP